MTILTAHKASSTGYILTNSDQNPLEPRTMQNHFKKEMCIRDREEVERIHEKMDELGIRSMGAYLRKMALDGYCIRLDLQDVKALVSVSYTHLEG